MVCGMEIVQKQFYENASHLRKCVNILGQYVNILGERDPNQYVARHPVICWVHINFQIMPV